MRQFDVHTTGSAPTSVDEIRFGPATLQGVRMRFGRNEEIFGEGEPADYVYRVVSGAVRTIRFSSEGRRQIAAFHLPGDVFGLELRASHGFSAEAVADAEIVLVRRSAIEAAAAQSAAVARALLQLATSQLHEAHEHALVLGRKGAGERVAAFLLNLVERCTARHEFNLPMSRADIADYLGLTIETVSRTFAQMEREHAIALPSARHVVLRDLGALEHLQAA